MAPWSYFVILLIGSFVHLDAAPSIQSSHSDNVIGNIESKSTSSLFAISNEGADINSPDEEILKREITTAAGSDATQAAEKVSQGIKDTGKFADNVTQKAVKGLKDALETVATYPAKRDASLNEAEAVTAPATNISIAANGVSKHEAHASTADIVGKHVVAAGEKLAEEIKETSKAGAVKAKHALKEAGDKLKEHLTVTHAKGAATESVAPSTVDISDPASEVADEVGSDTEQSGEIFASGLSGRQKGRHLFRGRKRSQRREKSQQVTRDVHAEGSISSTSPSPIEGQNVRVVKDLVQDIQGTQEELVLAPATGLKGILRQKQSKKKPGKKAQIEGEQDGEEEEVRVVKKDLLQDIGGTQEELLLAPATGLKGALKPKQHKKKPGKKNQIEGEENEEEEEVRVVKQVGEPLEELLPAPADEVTSTKEAEAVIASPTEEEELDAALAKVANATAEVFKKANEALTHLPPAALS